MTNISHKHFYSTLIAWLQYFKKLIADAQFLAVSIWSQSLSKVAPVYGTLFYNNSVNSGFLFLLLIILDGVIEDLTDRVANILHR